jgi:hypothetical protein
MPRFPSGHKHHVEGSMAISRVGVLCSAALSGSR